VPHIRTDAGGPDPDQDLVVGHRRRIDVLEREDIRRAVPVLCHRLHVDLS
jgi:hypothetical protein